MNKPKYTTDIRESIVVLNECIDLQLKKSQDYQSPDSNVKQAMHYRRGIETIHDIMHGKMLRAESLMETIKNGGSANFESIEDTYKDLINYASFAVSYIRGEMDGQDSNRDMFNRFKSFTPEVYELTEENIVQTDGASE
jgi:hypothetical protein